MLAVSQRFLAPIIIFAAVCAAHGQETNSPEKPKVKVNVLNVCTPSQPEQQEISSALSRIPQRPAFSPDFEVDRGRSVLDANVNPLAAAGFSTSEGTAQATNSSEPTSAEFVRVRHDFANGSTFSNVQYSFSRDSEEMVETLVFRVRDPKDLLEVSIESRASSVTSAAAMLGASTPAGRIKLERFGKSSVVLARCAGANGGPAVDQSSYEPLFSSATSILSDYRGLLGAKRLVPEELAKMTSATHRNVTRTTRHQ